MDKLLLSVLTCPRGCEVDLQVVSPPGELVSPAREELLCPSCQTCYPVISGVPVLFPDEERRNFTTDKHLQTELIEKVRDLEQKIRCENRDKYAAVLASQEIQSLAWEYFFWENWLESEPYATVEFDRERIKQYLENEREGGGRKRFFKLVRDKEGSLDKKVVLNVGAGRDLLFEEFNEAGATVIEQDIVLDSLLALRRRGALGICHDLRSIPIKSSRVDIITCFATLHHIWPIEVPVKEMLRVLRPGGALYVNEPNGWAAPVLARNILDTMPSRLRRVIVGGIAPVKHSPAPHEKSISKLQLLKALKQSADFSEVESMFFHSDIKEMPPVLKLFHSILARVIPALSSHLAIYVRKSRQGS